MANEPQEPPVEQTAPFPHGSDLDPNNPVDMSADDWREVYGRMDPDEFQEYLDHDHSMDN